MQNNIEFVNLLLDALDASEGSEGWKNLHWTIEQHVHAYTHALELRQRAGGREPWFLRLGWWRVGNICSDIVTRMDLIRQRPEFVTKWNVGAEWLNDEERRQTAADFFMEEFREYVANRCEEEYKHVTHVIEEKGLPAYLEINRGGVSCGER